MFLSTKLAY